MGKNNFLLSCRPFIKKIPGLMNLFDFIRLIFLPTYNSDGLITIHNADFLKDPDFIRAYNTACKQHTRMPVHIKWRANTLLWAAKNACRLEGDFVECGVNRAFMSSAVMEYVGFKNLTDRTFYLFDTYCGLKNELRTEKDRPYAKNEYPDCYDFVLETFKDFTNVNIIKGAIPDTLTTVNIAKAAYLHIDMNCIMPERAALEHFWPKIVSGGIIILDDYGFTGHGGQKQSADEFAELMGVSILALPTGQGLLIK